MIYYKTPETTTDRFFFLELNVGAILNVPFLS